MYISNAHVACRRAAGEPMESRVVLMKTRVELWRHFECAVLFL